MKVHLRTSIRNVLVIYGHKSAWNARIARFLRKHHVTYRIMHRDKLGRKLLQGTDLVIVLGGDGTFLRASHHIHDSTCIIGINTRPRLKEGFFMQDLSKDFETRFHTFLCCGIGTLWKLQRLEALINGRALAVLALNEFYIGMPKSYQVARYTIQLGTMREFHKSSGIIVSTASGSHAWARSAGGKPMPICSTKLQLVVREPYTYRLSTHTKISRKILEPSATVTIKPSRQPLIIAADSITPEYRLRTNESVTVRASKKPLYRLLI